MGWAKYYEDDLSIVCNRMFVLENNAMIPLAPCSPNSDRMVKHAPNKPRHGLELYIPEKDSKRMARMLQLNGWWWSRKKECWCNDDLQINRDFAKKICLTANK